MSDEKKILTESGEDVTESVQVLYDIAHQSMDWGSGFLDNDEMRAVIQLAVTMGWSVPDLPFGRSEAIRSLVAEFPDHYRFNNGDVEVVPDE